MQQFNRVLAMKMNYWLQAVFWFWFGESQYQLKEIKPKGVHAI